MAVRIWLMVASRSPTVAMTRSVARPGPRVAASACSDRPPAKRRWMTWSCRSAAMRSRSSNRAARCWSARAWASSRATAAWFAKPVAMSRSSALNAARPRSRTTVEHAVTRLEPRSGTPAPGRRRAPSDTGVLHVGATRRVPPSGAASPVVNTRPDSERSAGPAAPRCRRRRADGHLRPAGPSPGRPGAAMVTRSASATSRLCSAMRRSGLDGVVGGGRQEPPSDGGGGLQPLPRRRAAS